jgi:cyclin H
MPLNLSPTIYDTALNHIRASRQTDVELIYSPSQIALAAFSIAAPDLASKWAESKLQQNALPAQLSLETVSPVLELIKSIILNEGHAPEVEAVREVDRRLRLCKNPEKVVGSKAYLVKQEEEERRAEEKRHKKVLEMQQGQMDPFGDEFRGPNLVDYDDDDD